MAQLNDLVVTGSSRFLNIINGQIDWTNVLNKPTIPVATEIKSSDSSLDILASATSSKITYDAKLKVTNVSYSAAPSYYTLGLSNPTTSANGLYREPGLLYQSSTSSHGIIIGPINTSNPSTGVGIFTDSSGSGSVSTVSSTGSGIRIDTNDILIYGNSNTWIGNYTSLRDAFAYTNAYFTSGELGSKTLTTTIYGNGLLSVNIAGSTTANGLFMIHPNGEYSAIVNNVGSGFTITKNGNKLNITHTSIYAIYFQYIGSNIFTMVKS